MLTVRIIPEEDSMRNAIERTAKRGREMQADIAWWRILADVRRDCEASLGHQCLALCGACPERKNADELQHAVRKLTEYVREG